MQPRFSVADHKHSILYRVRSHECDRQGVVHNARYLEMLEIARIEYCRDILRIPIDPDAFVLHHKFFFARNAMDYFSPARFDEELRIHTRIAKLGTTSVTLTQIVDSTIDNRRVLEAEAVMVSVDEATNLPKELDSQLRERAREWEQI